MKIGQECLDILANDCNLYDKNIKFLKHIFKNNILPIQLVESALQQ